MRGRILTTGRRSFSLVTGSNPLSGSRERALQRSRPVLLLYCTTPFRADLRYGRRGLASERRADHIRISALVAAWITQAGDMLAGAGYFPANAARLEAGLEAASGRAVPSERVVARPRQHRLPRQLRRQSLQRAL